MGYVIAGAVVLLLVLLIRSGTSVRGLRREHLGEIVGGLARLKAMGHDHEVRPEPPANAAEAAAQGIVTSLGVVILWTVRRDGETYVHHVSVSGRGRAWAFRGVLCAFVLDRLGAKPADVVSARSPSGVDHVSAVVPREEHERAWAEPLRPVPDQRFAALLSDLLTARDAMRRVEWAGSPFASSDSAA